MVGMNPYALPNIIAFVLLLVLSLAVIFQNSRDKSNRLLFALCLNLALSVGAGGLLHLWVLADGEGQGVIHAFDGVAHYSISAGGWGRP